MSMMPDFSAVSARRPRRHVPRMLRALAIASGLVLVVLVALLGVGYLTLATADDARARVDRVLALHDGERTSAGPQSRVLRALVAVEDRRFFDHGAVDVRAVGRAVVHAASGQRGDGGGSTIAQQLAREIYGAGALRSVGMAFKLERTYSKAQILGMYADVIYFGHGYWGIERASRGYFAKPAARLDWAEASLLAGLPQAPSAYDPTASFDKARARQREVLQALVRAAVLSPGHAHRAYRELSSLAR